MPFERPELTPESDEARREAVMAPLRVSSTMLTRIAKRFGEELASGLEGGVMPTPPSLGQLATQESSGLLLLDTYINNLPTGKETGVAYGLELSDRNIRAARVTLLGNNTVGDLDEEVFDFRDASNETISLRDSRATASMLVEAAASVVEKLLNRWALDNAAVRTPFGLSVSFAIDQSSIESAHLLRWSKGLTIGDRSSDPVVGNDLCALFNVGFGRHGVPATIVGALNDTTGTLLTGSYLLPPKQPRCLMALVVGQGVNSVYYQPNSHEYGYRGSVINTEISSYAGTKLGGPDEGFATSPGLPISVVDFEAAFQSEPEKALPSCKVLEELVATSRLPELARRLVIRLFRKEAPSKCWEENSLSFRSCHAILEDNDECAVTRDFMGKVWGWDNPSSAAVKLVREAVVVVFDRSAAITAVCVGTIARRTGRLQPALGGITAAMAGRLAASDDYQAVVRRYLDMMLERDTTPLIQFMNVVYSGVVGAALLSHMVLNKTF